MGRGDHYDVRGRTVLITGAANGIGAETARQLGRKGARLALLDRDEAGLERVAADSGADAATFVADVTRVDDLESAVEATVERFGGIDVALANAGVAHIGTAESMAVEEFERTIEVNLLGVWRTLRAVIPHVIERRGYVIAVASLAARVHAPLTAPYAASKAGVEALVNAMRLEVEPRGVRAGVAYFGYIDTGMVDRGFSHPAARMLRERTSSRATQPVPAARAAAAIVRGIERRSRRVIAPRRVIPLVLLPTAVVNALIESQLRRADFPEVMQVALEAETGSRAAAEAAAPAETARAGAAPAP